MRIVLLGYGRMGRAVEAQATALGHEVVVRLGRQELSAGEDALTEILAAGEVAIDFSAGALVRDITRAAAAARVQLVTGTTGIPEGSLEELQRAADTGIGVVHGPNFSIGVQVFFRLVRTATRLIDAAGGYDTHVHEAHHRHKVDHPSGTARRVAQLAVEEIEGKERWASGPPDGRADPSVLYVTSTRAGEIPGAHSLGFEGVHDRIELTHEARSREGFASGAVRAAEWIRDRRGLFTFDEVIDRILGDAEAERDGR